MKVLNIDISKISEPKIAIRINPNDAEVKNLAESIKKIGLINPITIKQVKKDKYEVVAGHRRFMACRKAEIKKLPCNIVNNDDIATDAIKITENVGRRSITDYEGIEAIASYMKKFNISIMEAAQTFGMPRQTLVDYVVLANAPDDIKMHLHKKTINRSVAVELMRIKEVEQRIEITKRAIDYKWSSSAAKQAVVFYEREKQVQEDAKNAPELKTYNPIERKQTFACQMCEDELLAEEIQEVFVCTDCREIVEQYKISMQKERNKPIEQKA